MVTNHTGWTGYHVNVRHRLDPSTAPASELVVALDGSVYAERSLEVADAFAAAAGLPIRLVVVRPSPAELSSAQSYLTRVARRIPRVDDVTVDITTDVSGALAASVQDGALVVLATHARRTMGEVLFGSVADRLLRTTDRPVLLVGPNAGVPDPTFATMVVPDDGGLGGRRVRPSAQLWCEHLQAVPWVVQVLPGRATDPRLDVFEAAHVEEVANELGPESQWEVLHGSDPAERIVDFATEHGAGLITLAVPARHRVGPDVGGGVALQVVRHAPCPVLGLDRSEP